MRDGIPDEPKVPQRSIDHPGVARAADARRRNVPSTVWTNPTRGLVRENILSGVRGWRVPPMPNFVGIDLINPDQFHEQHLRRILR